MNLADEGRQFDAYMVGRRASVTKLYAVLPDFTVDAMQPVFLRATEELSRKGTRS